MSNAAERHHLAVTTARLVGAGLVIGQFLEESFCPCCGRQAFDVAKRRRNTAYCESREAENWLISCKECFVEDTEHFAELWDTYYAGLW